MERQGIEQMRVYAKISRAALRHNMEAMRDSLPEGIRIAGVVKADAYGHGAALVADTIKPYVSFFCVATAEEALGLRKHGIEKPVLVLGPVFDADYEDLVRAEIRPSIFTEAQAEALSKAAEKLGRKAAFHLAVDTGMHRIGLNPDAEGVLLAGRIAAFSNLDFEGMFTHFYRADEWSQETTELQEQRFRDFRKALRERGLSPRICHIANSAGILNLRGTEYDRMRAGISIYGIYPATEMAHPLALEPVLSLHSTVTYVKELPAGGAVSYGGTFVAERPMRVATVSIGYGDGYPRALSNKGEVLIHGKRCRILGRVCMDQLMADVSAVPEARTGSPVTLLGRDGEACITLEELAERSGRFHYEILCCLNQRVPRIDG